MSNSPADGLKVMPGLGLAIVRVVLKVSPPGAPSSTLVKSFIADLVN